MLLSGVPVVRFVVRAIVSLGRSLQRLFMLRAIHRRGSALAELVMGDEAIAEFF